MNLNIREIEYILTIMEEGSITKASQKLFIAQPSLSQVLKRVENELGVTLFTRVKNRLKLTPEGEVFIDAGQRIMKVIGELDQNFSGLSTAQSGRLVVGVPYLLGTLIAHFTGLHIDGWAGLLVAACILFTGYHAAKDTISPLLGQPPAPELVSEIEQTLLRHKGILGVHDLIVHDYGPGRMFVSAHAEVPANGDILALHDSIDNAERELAGKLGCVASIHMDPVATDDLFTMQLKDKVEAILHAYDERLSLHDFRVVAGPTHTNVIFDIVVPYQYIRSDGEVRRTIQELIHCFDNSLYAVIQIDHSYTGI